MNAINGIRFIFLFLMLLTLPLDGRNYYNLTNPAFRIDLDRVTSGFSISQTGKDLISSGYPPSTFALLTIDGKEYDLYREARIESIKTQPDLLITTFVLGPVTVVQEIGFEKTPAAKESGLSIAYKVKNMDMIDHAMKMAFVMDVIPGIKDYSLQNSILELQFSGSLRPVVFEVPDGPSTQIKPGDYNAFKSDFWKNTGGIAKNKNSVAVFMREQTIPGRDRFLLSVRLRQSEGGVRKEKPVNISDDIDSLLDELTKTQVKQTPTLTTNRPSTISLPPVPDKSIQTQTNRIKQEKTIPVPVKPEKKIKNPDDLDQFDDLINDLPVKTNKENGK
jgi:hypothetical protein